MYVCVRWYSKHTSIHRNFPECLHRNFHLLSIVALASVDALPKLPSTILHLNGTAPYPHYTSVVSPFNHCGSFFALQSQHAFVNDPYCTYHNRGWRSAYYTTLPVVRISVSRGPAGDSYKVLDANGWRLLVLYSKSMVLMIVWVLMWFFNVRHRRSACLSASFLVIRLSCNLEACTDVFLRI